MPVRKQRGHIRPERSAPKAGELGLDRAPRWLVPVALGVLVLVALALRASDLGADPPPDLSWSFAPYTDEALNTYSARNLVLYGAWKVDDFFPFVVYPLANMLAALVFKLFGVGFVQVKLVSVVAGAGSVVALFFLVRDAAGRLAGLLAALGMATCFPLVMYSRLGLVEPLQILFLLLAGLFYGRGLERPRLMILSGLFAVGTVLLVKISAVFVAPVMVVLFAWQFAEARRAAGSLPLLRRATGWWLVGAGAALLVWLVAVFLPHRADYLQYVVRHSLESPAGHPHGLAAYLLNTFTVGMRAGFIARLPFLALLGFLFMPGFGLGPRPGLRFLFVWFVFGLLMLGYMNYRPPRYETILLPVLIAVAAAAIGRFLERGTLCHRMARSSVSLLPGLRAGIAKAVAFSVWLWPLVVQLAFYTRGFWGMVRARTEAGMLAACFGISVALAIAGYLAWRRRPAGIVVRPVASRVVLAGLLVLLVLRLDVAQYSGWFGARTHDLVEYGRYLDRTLPDDAVLAGNWAPELLLGSKKRALAITDWANADDPVGRFGVTHVVSAENGFDEKLFRERYPELMQAARVVRQQRFRGIPVTVYELPR